MSGLEAWRASSPGYARARASLGHALSISHVDEHGMRRLEDDEGKRASCTIESKHTENSLTGDVGWK